MSNYFDGEPRALRLAEWLEHRTMIMLEDKKAAAELRRLHEVNQELVEALGLAKHFINSNITIEQSNFDSPPEPASKRNYYAHCIVGELDAAIAKARGEG